MKSLYDYFDADPKRFARKISIAKYVWYIIALLLIAIVVKPAYSSYILQYIPTDILAKVPQEFLADMWIRIVFGVLTAIALFNGFLASGGIKNKDTGGTIHMKTYYKFDQSMTSRQEIIEAFEANDFETLSKVRENPGESLCLEVFEDGKAKIYFLALALLYDEGEEMETIFKELKQSDDPANYKYIKKML